MRMLSFGNVNFPAAQQVIELPREAKTAYLEPPGYLFGERDLYGVSSPMGNQRYRVECIFAGDQRAALDNLLRLLGRREWLTQRLYDGATRTTLAKLIRCDVANNAADSAARIARVRCEFVAEPYWYSDPVTVSFNNTTALTITHQGNARCMRHLLISVITLLSSSGLRITGQNCEIAYVAATNATLVIDVGDHAVRVGGINAFQNVSRPDTQIPLFWLQPGVNNIAFSRQVSGSVTFRHTYV